MTTNTYTEDAYQELFSNRFPDKCFIEDITTTLLNAQGMTGLIVDAAAMGQYEGCHHDIKLDNLELTGRQIETLIKDALILVNGYWYQQRKLQNNNL